VRTSKDKHGATGVSSSALYAVRRCGDQIYFSTDEVSLKQTETNQVKGKFYNKKIHQSDSLLVVLLNNVTAGRGDDCFYTLSPN
jgi:hypothetical protein